MCGVVAALGSPNLTEPMRRIAHRGIRSTIVGRDHGVVGHVRLPIVGLKEAHDQPMERGGRWIIGFVGELLDFREINPEYECDAELVADIWASSGPYGFTNRDGFWGIAAVDDELGVLHVLTDYLGQKPMYYRADRPSAASEIDALIPFGPVTLDEVYLSACIKWGYCPDIQRTPYNEIKHVRPGEHVTIMMSGFVRCQVTDPLRSMPCSADGLYAEIDRAVKRRVLSSDVPVACLVSGGLDSAMVYTMAKRYGNPVAYHASESAQHDEEYWKAVDVVRDPAKPLLNRTNLTLETVHPLKKITWEEVMLVEALDLFQEPIDLGSLRPQIALARAVKERVCLTGDGADELFGGYGRSMRYDSQHSDIFQELAAWHLPRLDRAMMRNRIEVRSPFLARNVVQMAMSLPHELRQDKMYLRALASRDLPPKITQAKKLPLRTDEIAMDREGYTALLVDKFRERFNAGHQ